MNRLQLLAALTATTCFATPAWAVTNTTVLITQDQSEVPESRISLFNADTGAQVQAQPDQGAGAVFLLDGGTYRVMVDGKEVERVSVTGAGSRTVRVRMPSAGVPADGPPPGLVALTGTFLRIDVPSTGTGFFRNGAAGSVPEVFAVTLPDRIDHYGGTAYFQVPVGGVSPLFSFHYSEGESGPLTYTIAAAAGTASGVVYGALSPGGSSGISSSLGSSGSIALRSKQIGVAVDVPLVGNDAGTSAFGPTLFYRHWDRQYDGLVNFNSGGLTYAQARAQNLDEDQFGVGVFGRFAAEFSAAFKLHGTVRGGAYLRKSGLDSVETNTCSFCAAADRTFVIATNESESDVGVFADGAAAFELAITPDLSLWIGGGGGYRSRTAGIFNPNSGNQVFVDHLRTALTRQDQWVWEASAGFSLALH